MMRVYLPSTLPALAGLVGSGRVEPVPLSAYAVTPALREWYTEGDDEELEYAAMTVAAQHSLRMLAADPRAPRRRVVIAADAAEGDVTAAGDLGQDAAAVRVSAAIPIASVASAHVDDPVAETDVGAAVEALPAADTGDHDAEFTVDGAQAHELAWYAVQEIGDLVDGGHREER